MCCLSKQSNRKTNSAFLFAFRILAYNSIILISFDFCITGVLTQSENDSNFVQLKSALENYNDILIDPIFNDPQFNITNQCTYTFK